MFISSLKNRAFTLYRPNQFNTYRSINNEIIETDLNFPLTRIGKKKDSVHA